MQTLDYGSTRPSPLVPLVQAALVFGVGVLLGAAVWWLSPRFTGEAEPWDSSTSYYPVALALAGAAAALASPRRFWAAPVGVWLGQFAYVAVALPVGPMWLLGMFVGAFYALYALAGAIATYGAWRALAPAPRRPHG